MFNIFEGNPVFETKDEPKPTVVKDIARPAKPGDLAINGGKARVEVVNAPQPEEPDPELPPLPEDAGEKTYVLKAVNGTKEWVEEAPVNP